MNLGTMKTALQRYAGVDSSDPLVDWINAAMHEFEEAYPWPFLEDVSLQFTAVGADILTVAAIDVFKIIKVRVVNASSSLNYKPRIAFEEEISDPTKRGMPQIYTLLHANSIIMYPVPDQAYQVRVIYEKELPDLVNDVDVPACASRYHYTIVEGATVRALQAESEEDRASTARTVFEDSIDRHITKLGGSAQGGQFNTVRDTQGYGS